MVVTADGIGRGCEASAAAAAAAGQGALRDVSGTVPDGAAAATAIRVLCTAAAVRHQFSRSFRAVRSSAAVSSRVVRVFRSSDSRTFRPIVYATDRCRFYSSLYRGWFFRVHPPPIQTFDNFYGFFFFFLTPNDDDDMSLELSDGNYCFCYYCVL